MSVRFEVTKSDNNTQCDHDVENDAASEYTTNGDVEKGKNEGVVKAGRLGDLYEEESGLFATLMTQVSLYNPNPPTSGTMENGKKSKKSKSRGRKSTDGKMGTFFGVFLPCIQNIFGVLFFIRLSWIVGTAGIFQAFWIVFICCSVTFLTSISLSAIATNGEVRGGGPYFMISRNLGRELGGAVGILFYLGTTVAGSMYIIGAVEILIFYLAPQTKIFEVFQCFRLFGTGFLIVVGLIVMAGMKVVNKFALPGVIMVLLCIFLTFVGVFVNFRGSDTLKFCMVNDRPISLMRFVEDNPNLDPEIACNATSLKPLFCWNLTDNNSCDEYYKAAMSADGENGIHEEPAITGLARSGARDNVKAKYLKSGDIVSRKIDDSKTETADAKTDYYVTSDISTSFIILIGVFFPSVTGIMAGSNRSGDLKDPSTSIPRGTILATTSSSIVYLLGTVLFGLSMDEVFLRDKFGESAYGKLAVAQLAWPHPKVIQIGCFLSTLGAGLQSLTGAPRLLCAIAKDGVIPALSIFEKTTRFGEPLRAQLLTFAICELGILIAQLESLTALITQFFLMCYLSTNAACGLQGLLRAPSWRPRFHYYHWTLSMLGAILCVAVMFMSHWWFALIAVAIGIAVYKYIEYRGAEMEWGDGIKGLALSAANFALLNVDEGQPHAKNWRPQLLVLCGIDENMTAVKHDGRLVAFASQLKAGRGLTVISTVLEGDIVQRKADIATVREVLRVCRDKYRIKGFTDVLVSKDVTDGVSALIQTCGLGGLKPNTVIVSWPATWQTNRQSQKTKIFATTVRNAAAAKRALLAVKNVDLFPVSSKERLSGTIDVWWVVHDGGMLVLLGFLLKQHKVWRRCRLRLFTVAQIEDNSVKMEADLRMFLYQLRIEAEIAVVEMHDSDISEYVYERTLIMETRYQMLSKLLSDREKNRELQGVVDNHHPRKLSIINEEDERRKISVAALPVTKEESAEDKDEDHDKRSETHQEAAQKLAIPIITQVNMANDAEAESETLLPTSTPHTDSADVSSASRSGVAVVNPMPQTSAGQSAGLPAKPTEYNVRRMHTAMKLNQEMLKRSGDAQLVIVNLPVPSRTNNTDENYMEFVEVLTEKLKRVVLVRGAGLEVVTIFS